MGTATAAAMQSRGVSSVREAAAAKAQRRWRDGDVVSETAAGKVLSWGRQRKPEGDGGGSKEIPLSLL